MYTGSNFVLLDIPEKENNILPVDTLMGTTEIENDTEEKIIVSSSGNLKDWVLLNKNMIIISTMVLIGIVAFVYYKKNRQ